MKRLFPFTLFLSLLTLVSCVIDPGNVGNDSEGPYVMIQRDLSGLTNQWANAICYGGSRNGQSPESDPPTYPSYAEVKEDLLILEKNWKWIKTYSAGPDSETVLQVIHNEHIGLKIFLGVWISQYDSVNYDQITNAIRMANQYPAEVGAVIVGNEALYSGSDHKVSASKMIDCIRSVRKKVSQPVTVADVFDYWLVGDAPLVAAEIDFIMVHIYPLWWGETISNATGWTTNHYDAVRYSYPGKLIVIGEAGWATQSDNTYMVTNQANEENQDRYYRELVQWASNDNVLTFYFQAFDEDWKHSFPYYDPADPEKHWGLFMTNRKAKLAMYGLYPELIDPSHVPSSNI